MLCNLLIMKYSGYEYIPISILEKTLGKIQPSTRLLVHLFSVKYNYRSSPMIRLYLNAIPVFWNRLTLLKYFTIQKTTPRRWLIVSKELPNTETTPRGWIK